jgi:caffeoyl-CoA O-methyltransferase
MLSLVPEAIEQYVGAHSASESPLFAELRARTHAELAMPQMQVGHVEGALLRLLVGISGAKRVLEIGTFSGYSTLCMAEALPADGKLVTCDIDPVATTLAREFWAKSPHGAKIELRLAPALDTVAQLARDACQFDVVFLDADKVNYPAYYEACWDLLVPGGLFIADNMLWSGKVVSPTTPEDHAIARLGDIIHADTRVDHVLLSVRDGIMLARKRFAST